LRILDPQGRVIRTLDGNGLRAAEAGSRPVVWDGLDARGQAVPWGSYYLNATAPGSSMTLLLPWVP
jgi:flagellar hook assembly protein FlgD